MAGVNITHCLRFYKQKPYADISAAYSFPQHPPNSQLTYAGRAIGDRLCLHPTPPKINNRFRLNHTLSVKNCCLSNVFVLVDAISVSNKKKKIHNARATRESRGKQRIAHAVDCNTLFLLILRQLHLYSFF